MACSRNENCHNIANDYKGKIEDIKNDCRAISSILEDDKSSLTTYQLPDDYLGDIIREELETIKSSIDDKIIKVNDYKIDVTSFVNNKIVEHDKHYEEWCKQQRKLLETQDEVTNDEV